MLAALTSKQHATCLGIFMHCYTKHIIMEGTVRMKSNQILQYWHYFVVLQVDRDLLVMLLLGLMCIAMIYYVGKETTNNIFQNKV